MLITSDRIFHNLLMLQEDMPDACIIFTPIAHICLFNLGRSWLGNEDCCWRYVGEFKRIASKVDEYQGDCEKTSPWRVMNTEKGDIKTRCEIRQDRKGGNKENCEKRVAKSWSKMNTLSRMVRHGEKRMERRRHTCHVRVLYSPTVDFLSSNPSAPRLSWYTVPFWSIWQ